VPYSGCMTQRVNNDETVTTDAGQFMLIQRNEGYADNDGRWVVDQLRETYWSHIGTLRQRRLGAFLGIFNTRQDADAAIASAVPQPINDQMIL
jgi:hypothetical protein